MQLREYQQKAVLAAMTAFASGIQSTLIVCPTGGGKTIIAAHIAKDLVGRGRVMVLVHREELLNQAADKFRRITGIEPAVEKAERFSDEDNLHGKPPIVIASVQSLNSGDDALRRLHRFDPLEFSFVWQDEAHHAPAVSFRRCLDHFKKNPDVKILLVTATPDRADERGLAEVCDHVSFDYELSDIIRDGYLVPIRQRRVTIEGLEFARIRTVGGDFDQGELEAAMLAEKPLHGVVHATIEQSCNLEIGYLETIRDDPDRIDKLRNRLIGRLPRKTLLFTVSVAHAERVAEIINRWLPDSAMAVSGGTPPIKRAGIIADFASGATRFLSNCAIALEGFDEPSIEIVSMARPTKSRPLYAQAVGRGTRPAQSIAHKLGDIPDAEGRRKLIAESEKRYLEVLDFVGNSGRHKLVCTADILGTAKPDEVVELAAEIAQDETIDMTEALEQAEKSIEVGRELVAMQQEMEAEEADLRDEERNIAECLRRLNVIATATYNLKQVSGFEESRREPEQVNPNNASIKQVEFLVSLGCDPKDAAGWSKRQAGAVITSLKAKRGTNRQRFALKRFGFSPEEIESMSFDACSAAIDQAMKGGVK